MNEQMEKMREEIEQTLNEQKEHLEGMVGVTSNVFYNCQGWIEALEYVLGYMDGRADGKILVMWPESQRIMEHPDAELDLDHTSAYWIPSTVWALYNARHYKGGEEE